MWFNRGVPSGRLGLACLTKFPAVGRYVAGLAIRSASSCLLFRRRSCLLPLAPPLHIAHAVAALFFGPKNTTKTTQPNKMSPLPTQIGIVVSIVIR